MSKKSAIFLLVIALAGGGYYYYHTQISCSFLSQKEIKVDGKECDVRSREGIEKLGIELRRIPNGKNAAILYIKASNVVKKPKGRTNDCFKDVAANEWVTDRAFTKWFDRNAEGLKLIHRAARKPDAEFPVFGSDDEPAFAILLPHLVPMRRFARLLACEGKRYEYKGDCSRALDSYLAITALAEHVRDSNAMLISDLVAIACHSIRNRAVERCLANRSVSEADLRRVIEHYERFLESYMTLADCLTREKCCEDSMVEEMMRDPRQGLRMLAEVVAGPGMRRSIQEQERIVRLIETRGAELKAAYERDYAALERWSALPAWQALRPGSDWTAYIERLPQTSFFSRQVLSAVGKAKKQYARSEAEAGGVLIFAALKLYEKKNGRPPASLAELKGEYISDLPKDPFSGRDYVYKVRGKDWILYSVWDNLTDDNGTGSWPHKYSDDKDFVWRNTRIAVK